jgi:hypothetical protein
MVLETDTAKEPPKEDEKLQVSVLISMPSPNARKAYEGDMGSEAAKGAHILLRQLSNLIALSGKGKGPGQDDGDNDEADIPDVVFGVAEVNFRP